MPLHADTKILTRSGWMHISDAGTCEVWTGTEFCKVNAERAYSGIMGTVGTGALSLSCSVDHEFITYDGRRVQMQDLTVRTRLAVPELLPILERVGDSKSYLRGAYSAAHRFYTPTKWLSSEKQVVNQTLVLDKTRFDLYQHYCLKGVHNVDNDTIMLDVPLFEQGAEPAAAVSPDYMAGALDWMRDEISTRSAFTLACQTLGFNAVDGILYGSSLSHIPTRRPPTAFGGELRHVHMRTCTLNAEDEEWDEMYTLTGTDRVMAEGMLVGV